MRKQVILKTETGLIDFLEISSSKLRDAWVLFTNERFEGACYNVGYTIECLIKYVFLSEFRCEKRQDVFDLYKSPEACVKRIYKFCNNIHDFEIEIFGLKYNEINKKDFQKLGEDIYLNVLAEHSFEYGLIKLIDFNKTTADLSNYKYILDWSEQWRYRLLTEKKLKNGMMIKKETQHNVNSKEVCEAIIKEISGLIQQFYSDGLISQGIYEAYYRNILEKEVGTCLNISAQLNS